MSKRSRPQPITAPAPESFLPSFDFGSPVKPRSGGSKALPKRKMPDLSKRLAAFAFLNLEDIQEEADDLHAALNASPISTAPSTKGARFWDFSRPKNSSQRATSPSTPQSLPPMSSKAYATLVGGGGTTPSSAKSTFSKTPSSKRRSSGFSLALAELDQVAEELSPLSPATNENKSLAVDLVSIFSVSTAEDADNKTRFSFPMPPSFTPRRGSQSPLDPDISFSTTLSSTSSVSPQSPESGFSDYSFFSPLFSAGFGARTFLPAESLLPPVPEVAPTESISPLEKVDISPKKDEPKPKRARPTRPTLVVPPAAPPPHDSPPPTPSSVTSQRNAAATLRACPSPELDPELSAHSSTTSIASVLESSESESESVAPSPAPPVVKELPPAPMPDVFANWDIGSPSRSDSIVTITQRAFNAMRPRGSISNIGGSFSTVRGGSISAGSPMSRNGSWGSGEMYDWEQAIDDIYLRISRKPSIASIALAASAEGAALPTTSLDVVADTAFVMDDEMRRKLMESQYLVPTRQAPRPPSPARSAASSATKSTTKKEMASSSAASDSDWVSASATSSARSSLDEQRPSPVHSHGPSTPVYEDDAPIHAIKSRPAPLITSPSYPPVNPLRLKRPNLASTLTVPDSKMVLPLDVQSPRPPPTQSIPTSDAETSSAIFSPMSATSPPFMQPIDIDNWPLWSSSSVDASLEKRRDIRRPSANGTMISKFSDDSVDASKKKRTGTPKTGNRMKKSSPTRVTKPAPSALSPGSAHTSYTFLGLKRKAPTSSGNTAYASFSPKVSQEAAPRTSLESARSGSSDESKRNGLKRPPLPLELFIRA
ncbi:SubName: Full=Uncharacterized protein {ECO:0000313/EMBL:CCA73086.1} [Serendipita indica DSM 11827]|nr:SubName: Full=Uncharacterized protein {ECO:0000313/EMBL:CCA73086.1} [Serendipita indica DSM 11827]